MPLSSTFSSTSVRAFESAAGASLPGLDDALRTDLLGRLLNRSDAIAGLFRLNGLELVYLNAAAKRRFEGAENVPLAGRTLADFFGVSCQERLQSEMITHARVRGSWTGRSELRDAWGSDFPAAVLLCVERAGGAEFLCLHAVEGAANATDPSLTDRDLLNALLEHSPEVIFFKDRASRFLRISHAHARLFGIEHPREAIGKTDFDFYTAEQASPAFQDEQAIIRTGQPFIDKEEKQTWSDGRTMWVSTNKLPLRDPEGQIVGTFGISRDITARKQAEEQRRQMEVKLHLAQRLESIGRLAAGIAHEINTPSQFITDNTNFLVDAFAGVARQIEAGRALARAAAGSPACAEALAACAAAEAKVELDYLLREIPLTLQQTLEGLSRIARIVSSLKEFSHPKNASRAPSDLKHVIETAINVSRHEWKYVAEVVTEFAPDLPPVPCVVDEFNQVILNLIVNAAHAIESVIKANGGRGRGRITVRTRREGEHVCVEVIDTGAGIPEEIRGRIFEPFFTTKEIGKGSGQGLAIVRAVIEERHQGRVEFASEVNRGTTFRLFLPLDPPPGPAPSTGLTIAPFARAGEPEPASTATPS